MVVILGVDYSSHPPRASSVAAVGYRFACRYLAPLPNPKVLTAVEAQALLAAGVDVVMIWETAAGAVLGGAVAGGSHGMWAKQLAARLGAPTVAAIYYAVDFDAQPAQLPAVRAYQSAFAAAIAPHPVGVYGSAAVVDAMVRAGAVFAWQTAAWSHGRRSPAADLYQRVQQVVIDGTVCDVNEASGSYGGWQTIPPDHPTPIPLPPPLTDPEEPSVLIPVLLPVTTAGSGYWDLDGNAGTVGDPKDPPRPLIKWAQFRSVTINGNDGTPTDDGKVHANQHGDIVRLGFAGFGPGSAPLVWVQAAATSVGD